MNKRSRLCNNFSSITKNHKSAEYRCFINKCSCFPYLHTETRSLNITRKSLNEQNNKLCIKNCRSIIWWVILRKFAYNYFSSKYFTKSHMQISSKKSSIAFQFESAHSSSRSGGTAHSFSYLSPHPPSLYPHIPTFPILNKKHENHSVLFEKKLK